MRIVAISSKVGDIVTPTQAAIDANEDLRKALKGCRHNQGEVILVYDDYMPCPIVVQFENNAIYPLEQSEIEK